MLRRFQSIVSIIPISVTGHKIWSSDVVGCNSAISRSHSSVVFPFSSSPFSAIHSGSNGRDCYFYCAPARNPSEGALSPQRCHPTRVANGMEQQGFRKMSLQIRGFLHNSFWLNSARRMRSKSVLDIKITVILIPFSLLQVSFCRHLDFLTTCCCCK